ncbi:MAG: SCO family protein [Rhodospirillales bacterium]
MIQAGKLLSALLPAVLLLGGAFAALPAAAQYNRTPESDIDPAIFKIDETKHLGAKVDGSLGLIDGGGNEFTLSDMLGQPLILVFSYYTCDGSCSVINLEMAGLLADVKKLNQGEDFRVLTVSFDKNDTLETMAAFREQLEAGTKIGEGWTFALAKDHEGLKELAEKVGYKFFWSPRDRTFFHPAAFLFLSSEGRLIRVLYSSTIEAGDVELAVLDSRQGRFRPGQVIEYAVSLCYSYNYKEGRYTFNIPLFVGMGSLALGVSAFSVAALSFRRRKKTKEVLR